MKRRGVLLVGIAVLLLSVVTAYGKELNKNSNDIIITNKHIKQETSVINEDINFPKVSSTKYIEGVDKINTIIEKDIFTWREDLTQLSKQYEKDFKDSKDELIPFELVTKYDVTYNDNNLLSIPMDYYQFTGGAHGLTTKIGYNFQVDTGNKLKLKDLFNDNFDFKTIINKKVSEEIAKNPQEYFGDGADFKGIKDEQDFYLDKDGLVVYFQLYEIAPYSSGIKEFRIPYGDIEKGLKIQL